MKRKGISMSYENIKVEKREGIGYVTLNRPERLNALNDKTVEELYQAFKELKEDEEVSVIIVTGAGEKAFVAGADINEIAALTPISGREQARRGQAVLNFIESLGKPVIAAVNGFALGGGCELAMACAIRVASDNARLGQPEVNLGVMPGYAGTQRLPRLVGQGRALEIILTGRMVNAEEALRIGLVNKVVPQAELIKSCEEMARTIMSKGPLAIRFCLEAVNAGLNMPLAEAQEYEATLFGVLCATEDMREGTKAFLEKRQPKFKGK